MRDHLAIHDRGRQRFRAAAAIVSGALALLIILLGDAASGVAPDGVVIAAIIAAGTLATTATAYGLTLAGTWWRGRRTGKAGAKAARRA